MTQQDSVTFEVDASGVGLVSFDQPGRAMNVLTPELLGRFATLLERLEKEEGLKGLVLTSGKSSFIAGADIDQLSQITTVEQAFQLGEELKALLRRMEKCGKPVVAALNGTTLGGVIVDSGNFDWVANAERFPGLTQPDPSYHGVVWSDALGPAAYIGRVRTVLLRNTGAALSPFNAFLLLQGLETLPLRMERHSENALAVAEHLSGNDHVTWVNYPGLPDFSHHETANKVLTGGYGALVTFGIKGGRDAGRKFIDSLELFSHLANIGDAKSLATHPASTTHRQLSPEELKKAGVSEDMVRISVGIEDLGDLAADVAQALDAV